MTYKLNAETCAVVENVLIGSKTVQIQNLTIESGAEYSEADILKIVARLMNADRVRDKTRHVMYRPNLNVSVDGDDVTFTVRQLANGE